MLSRVLPVHRRQRNNNWTRQKSREWAPEGFTYFYCLEKSSRHFAISCFKHAQLGTLYLRKLERSPLWLVLNVLYEPSPFIALSINRYIIGT